MASVTKSTVVPYSAERMYRLVNDVEAYPEFLPWCMEARVTSPGETRLTASLTLHAGKIRQTFATENTMQPGRRIDVHLLSGPFKHLRGHWLFEPLDEHSCRITMEMDFEFKNKLLKLTLSAVFNHVINSLVEAFTRRAGQVYGHE